jgi:cellulose synthase/poly-beta-1,6-N-acetylglucosamine synthase-like glycosyltransferase
MTMPKFPSGQSLLARHVGRFAPPIAEAPWSRRREVVVSAIGAGFTLLATAFVGIEQAPVLAAELQAGAWGQAAGHVAFLGVAGLLVYGGLVYQITRLLYARRRQPRRPSAPPSPRQPAQLSILVPSYKEERAVIEQTLLSAALQELPGLRVTLLIDNPPDPTSADDRALLATARAIPVELQRRLDAARAAIAAAPDDVAAAERAADWLEAEAEVWLAAADNSDSPHTARFFACEILLDRAIAWREAAAAGTVDRARLEATFDVALGCFERKRYPNLSQEANKAMNLNSYIGLMGREWTVEPGTGELRAVGVGEGDLAIPRPDFIIALDADSLILPGYAETLLAEMQRPGNERLAICQTPYSAIPDAPGTLERVAGATTDVQYIIHQGFTAWDGTYWVGANAMMRYEALLDIAEQDTERGHPITRYIQDHTVIEDTESTIDLTARGWTLHNVPQRLAFSATPPDFGSLLIQRRRWSNGGLLILGKALRHLSQRLRGGDFLATGREAFVRIHYLVSITTVNFGLLLLLAYPITSSVGTFWLPLTAVPYFWLYGRDLRLMGYDRWDLIRVYALNLLLIPVHIGGVLQSIRQGLKKTKLPFSRTPKVADRTRVAPPYIAVTYFLIGQWTTGAVWDFYNGYPSHGVFSALNAAIMAYAVTIFIGWRQSWQDL